MLDFLITVMTSFSGRMLNSVIVEIYSGYLSEPDESPGMVSSFLRMFFILPIKYLPMLLANMIMSGTSGSL